jgi:hypothetical protein
VLRDVPQGRRKVLGNAHSETAATLIDLGSCLEVQGKQEEARPLRAQAAQIREREPAP